MTRYDRNRIYLAPAEQDILKSFKVFITGGGIGSVIAECALRIGFENLTIIDGDTVELTNLNRQNYVESDISKSKAESLKKRLLEINSDANIIAIDKFITEENIEMLFQQHKFDIAINALDFTSSVPLKFDQLCQERGIPVLHPYNIGWLALVLIVMPSGSNLSIVSDSHKQFEAKVVEYVLNRLEKKSENKKFIEDILDKYIAENAVLSPPQLSCASYHLAGGCTEFLCKLALKMDVKEFPDFYLWGINEVN